MNERFCRLDALIPSASAVLSGKTVVVFGLGGVGGACVEALARCAVGALVIVDNDVVSPSNINRQLIALDSTIGKKKTELWAERIKDINPECRVTCVDTFYTSGDAEIKDADYVVDCIDTVSAKLALIDAAKKIGVPIISCMGTGNKCDPTGLKIADIEKTSTCPLARVMRRELKARGIGDVKVLFSAEQPATTVVDNQNGRHSPASAIFVPATAGLLIAREVVSDLIK